MLRAMETAAARLEAVPREGLTWAAGMEMASKQAAAAAEAAHVACTESQRRSEAVAQQQQQQQQGGGGGGMRRVQPPARPKVTKREAEAATARLYSGGGRKGFAALHAQVVVLHVEGGQRVVRLRMEARVTGVMW